MPQISAVRAGPAAAAAGQASTAVLGRQLGDLDGDPLRLVAGEQLGRGPWPWLVLAIDEGERLLVGVAHDETRGGLLDGPGRREAGIEQRGQ
jgi:hypothetical protein